MMQLLPLSLACAALAVANQQPDVVTVTNYLPFEQHRCYEYFMLGVNEDVTTEACQPGACCVDIKDANTYTDDSGNNVGGNNVGGSNVGGNNVGGNNIVGIIVGPDGHTTTTPCPCSSGAITKTITTVSQFSSGASSNSITSGPVTATSSLSGSTPKSPITSGSVVTSFSTSGFITLTLVEITTNNRTITEEIIATSIETLPETSRETEVITTTVPKLVTFNTTSSGQVIVETTTSEVVTKEIITSDVVISTTEVLTTPVVVTSTEVITRNNSTITSLVTTISKETITTILPSLTTTTETTLTTTFPQLIFFNSTSAGRPIVETTTTEVLTTETITTDVVISTTETLTTPVVVTSTEVFTPSDTPVTSLVTTTSEETLTTPIVVTSTEVITTSNTTLTSLVTTTSEETLTTPVIVTSTEVITPSDTPFISLVTITSEETLTSVHPILTTTDEINTTPSVVVTPTLTTITNIVVEPIISLIPPPPEPETSREIRKSCPTPTCSHGIQYALYKNPFSSDLTPTYESFSPKYFKKEKPVYSTTLQTAIFISDDNNGNGFNPLFSNAAAGYRGFLFACRAGRYRFNSPYSDDITIMWFGDKAYNSYTRENADIVQAYYGDNKPKDIYRDLAAGTYYPIRVLWGNTGGAADLSLRIYGPDGQDISGADQKGEHYLTTEACDGSYAPFPPWGQEK